VSKARDDFPDPEIPVITVSFSLGIRRLMFLRLCSLAPYISIKFRLSTGKSRRSLSKSAGSGFKMNWFSYVFFLLIKGKVVFLKLGWS
jgi:hypothetical protein